jgi:hypothetical protein
MWLLLLAAWASAPSVADQAVLQLVRSDTIRNTRVLYRGRADSELDIVVALGGSARWQPGNWWGAGTTLGLFLQRRDQPGLVYRIT